MQPAPCGPQNLRPGLRGLPAGLPRFARARRLLWPRRRGKAPTSPISPRHVRAHKAQRPAGARCAAHGWLAARRTSRGEATRTADQGVAGASAAVPSRSSSVVPPTLPRSAGGPRGCPAQPALALPVVSPRHASAPSSATPGGGGPPAQLYTRVLPSLEAICRIQFRRCRL